MAMTNAQLSRQASFIAKNAADYAADVLWCDERVSAVAGDRSVGRFLDMLRDRIEIIEGMHKEGRAPDTQTERGE